MKHQSVEALAIVAVTTLTVALTPALADAVRPSTETEQAEEQVRELKRDPVRVRELYPRELVADVVDREERAERASRSKVRSTAPAKPKAKRKKPAVKKETPAAEVKKLARVKKKKKKKAAPAVKPQVEHRAGRGNGKKALKAYAKERVASGQFGCLERLWEAESGWRADATNSSSGAHGIPQSLPGSKMAAAGKNWRTDGRTQIRWGLDYIEQRYGTPCAAWNDFQRKGWY